MALYAIDSPPIRHFINEKGTGAEVRPQLFLGLLLVTGRSAIGAFFYLSPVTVPEVFALWPSLFLVSKVARKEMCQTCSWKSWEPFTLPPPTFASLPAYISALAHWVKLSLTRRLTVRVTVVLNNNGEVMQQDGNTPVCAKVTGLSLACFVVIFNVSWSFTKRSV